MPGKVKYFNLNEAEKKKYLGDFYTMMAIPNNRKEMKNLLKDLLTISETVMISRRIQIAKQLLLGKSKREIQQEMGVGFSTINHVEKWLISGFGGYKKTLEKFQKQRKRRQKENEFVEPGTFEHFRKSRPAYFWLINAILDA